MTPRSRKRDGDSVRGKGDQQAPDGDEQRGPGNPDADPVRIHEEFVQRRLGGGAGATPEKYATAVDQWNELPGAVRVPPPAVSGDDAGPAPDESDEGDGEERPS